MKFTRREIKDLTFAGFMISLAFAILFSGGYKILSNLNSSLILAFVISFFTAGIGFLLHEMMHKYVAQSYGLRAEFYASYNMLWLALLFSFFGFIFAAPGAVMISGFMNRDKNGKVSLAGPMTNIILAFVFLILLLISGSNEFLKLFLSTGLMINALLGAFNMIPAMPFDGAKILAWNKSIYFITLTISLGLFFASWFF